jgi:two-component system, chemotaxis family, protein-glutamate methylesterase/glutaminase
MFAPLDNNNSNIIIGASAGGLHTVSSVICMLPRHSSTTVLILIHASPEGPGLLSRSSPGLPQFRSQSPLTATVSIRVTSASRGLIFTLHRGRRGSDPHRARANIVSPGGRSAASLSGRALRLRVIAVVMSGNLVDGTLGFKFINQPGRLAIAQDPSEGMIATIPQRATKNVQVDFTLPARIGAGPRRSDDDSRGDCARRKPSGSALARMGLRRRVAARRPRDCKALSG